MKLWGGRFTKTTETSVDEFGASISFDHVLARYDILGSLAHLEMLRQCGIVPDNEAHTLASGLRALYHSVERGSLEWQIADEDIHMNVERLLHESVGAVAGKLHTARSRNDQVALDLHLYVRDNILLTVEAIVGLQDALVTQAERHLVPGHETIMPGYTHLQRAQPILLAHHLLAYAHMLQRDTRRFQDAWARANVLPLGAGALAGTTFPIDRSIVAELLGFDAVYENSMDAVSDRDFVAEFLGAACLCQIHMSRLAEEIILWSSQEFGFVELDDGYSTGSSIMPQKKNPDVAELVRGKSGRMLGALVGLLTVLKGLPLTYNKDMQEDKEGLFDATGTVQRCLTLTAGMLRTLEFRGEKMHAAATTDYSNATDLADYLAKKGLPFRMAHEVAGRAVRLALDSGRYLSALSLDELKELSPLFDTDIFEAIDVRTVVGRRTSFGGTAPDAVRVQLEALKPQLEQSKEWAKARRAGTTTERLTHPT